MTADRGDRAAVLAVGVEPAVLGAPDGPLAVETVEGVAAARRRAGPHLDAAVAAQSLPDGDGLEALAAVREAATAAACFLLVEDPDGVPPGSGPVVDYVFSPEGLPGRVREAVAAGCHAPFPVGDDESERAALAASFDAAALRADGAFADLLAEAAADFDVPLAGVNLVGRNRLRVAGCHGADVESLDRCAVPCTYALLEDDVTVVDGLAEDPRFVGSPPVTDFGLAWYAGAPVAVDGHRVGTLCLYDDTARGFDEGDRRRLSSLAAEAERRLADRG